MRNRRAGAADGERIKKREGKMNNTFLIVKFGIRTEKNEFYIIHIHSSSRIYTREIRFN